MAQRKILFEDNFSGNALDLEQTWKLEGAGEARLERGSLALQEDSESQGVVLWARRDFPSDLCVEFDLSFSNNRGIGVFFLAAIGTEGEDIRTTQRGHEHPAQQRFSPCQPRRTRPGPGG